MSVLQASVRGKPEGQPKALGPVLILASARGMDWVAAWHARSSTFIATSGIRKSLEGESRSKRNKNKFLWKAIVFGLFCLVFGYLVILNHNSDIILTLDFWGC